MPVSTSQLDQHAALPPAKCSGTSAALTFFARRGRVLLRSSFRCRKSRRRRLSRSRKLQRPPRKLRQPRLMRLPLLKEKAWIR